MKLKVGDTVKAVSEEYVFTCERNNWIGVVEEVDDDGYFSARTVKTDLESLGSHWFGVLMPEHFEVIKDQEEG